MAQTPDQMLTQQKRFEEAESVTRYSGYEVVDRAPQEISSIVAEHIRLTSPEPDFKPDNSELKRLLEKRGQNG